MVNTQDNHKQRVVKFDDSTKKDLKNKGKKTGNQQKNVPLTAKENKLIEDYELKQQAEIEEAQEKALEKKKQNLKRRDFLTDLIVYLEQWKLAKYPEEGQEPYLNWKFNKNLQTWAILNCLDKEKIPSDTFKLLLPYLMSLQGNSRDRLVEDMQATINKTNDEEVNENETKDNNDAKGQPSNSMIKRASKIVELLSSDAI